MQLSAQQDVLQVQLVSISQSELSMDLRPRPPCSDQPCELDPLRLSVTWSHDDRFRLQVVKLGWDHPPPPCSTKVGVSCVQVSDGCAGLVEACVCGRRAELSSALGEVTQRYLSQFHLLAEIQGLRSRSVSTSC